MKLIFSKDADALQKLRIHGGSIDKRNGDLQRSLRSAERKQKNSTEKKTLSHKNLHLSKKYSYHSAVKNRTK